MNLGMSEQNPQTPNYEIANLSAVEKWLKADRWCSDLLKRANELDKLARAGQNDNDKNTVLRHYADILYMKVYLSGSFV